MGDVASIEFNLGFFCFIGLVLLSMAVSVSMDRRLFWYHLGRKQSGEKGEEAQQLGILFDDSTELPQTAANLGLMRCHDCGK